MHTDIAADTMAGGRVGVGIGSLSEDETAWPQEVAMNDSRTERRRYAFTVKIIIVYYYRIVKGSGVTRAFFA